MNELLTMSLELNDVKWLGEFPPELMTDNEQEMTRWVLGYTRKHGKTPSVRRIMELFELFIPYKFVKTAWEDSSPPIGDVSEQTIQRKLIDISERLLRQVDVVIKDKGIVPLEIFQEIEKLHALSQGVSRYSRFDRSLYFRRKAMNLPFSLINKHIGGISQGDFMLIIGRLGTGKSTIAQYIAKFVWERGMKVLFVSAEMLGLDVFSRIDAMVGKFNPLELRVPDEKRRMQRELAKVMKKVSKEPGEIIIPKSRLLSPAQIGSFAKNLDVDLIVVDGAYLLQPSESGYTSKWEKVANVSNELKQLALDLNLPLIATAQIKRGATTDGKYTPEDIALSDSLGQDSDFVIAVKPNKTIHGRVELQLIKNRYGSECATQVYIDFETMSITDETIEGAVEVAGPKVPMISTDEWDSE